MYSNGVCINVNSDIYTYGIMPEGCGGLVQNLAKRIPDFEDTYYAI
jgi:actin-like ATPase involved in cell morphogenesis